MGGGGAKDGARLKERLLGELNGKKEAEKGEKLWRLSRKGKQK